MTNISKDQLEHLFNLYTNAELALMFKLTRERTRQIRKELGLSPREVDAKRLSERMNKEYMDYTISGNFCSNDNPNIKAYALANSLPWPPAGWTKQVGGPPRILNEEESKRIFQELERDENGNIKHGAISKKAREYGITRSTMWRAVKRINE